jgi:membrane associated rhomboid family serine protease
MLAEGYFGHLRFGAIYLLGGLFGSAAGYAFSRSLSAGASGAIFALAGAITIYLIYYRENLGERGRSILQNMLIIIAINLAFGFANPGIDNWGHVGGLVGGALTAWGVMPRYETPALSMLAPQPLRLRQQPARDLTWVAGCATLLVLSVWWVTRGYLGI